MVWLKKIIISIVSDFSLLFLMGPPHFHQKFVLTIKIPAVFRGSPKVESAAKFHRGARYNACLVVLPICRESGHKNNSGNRGSQDFCSGTVSFNVFRN